MPPTRSPLPRAAAAAVVALALLPARESPACCMVPSTWGGDVDQAAQNGIVWHHDGHEELLLRIEPFFHPAAPLPGIAADAATAPPFVEWVVTVPEAPTAYGLAPRSVFSDVHAVVRRLEDLADAQFRARTRFDSGGSAGVATLSAPAVPSAAAHGLDVGAPVAVGPYEITPVRARGLDALTALNAYLAGRGLPQEDPAHMAWFVERGFTFLCIHITPPAGAARLGEALDLEPLRIRFASARPYYPAKFSSRQGTFRLALATVTSTPLATPSLTELTTRLRATTPRWRNLWTVQPLPTSLTGAGSGPDAADPATAARATWARDVGRWHVNAFDSPGFNVVQPDGRPALATWTDDVVFAPGDDDDAPPAWYYGDRDVGAVERHLREHGIADALVGGALGFVVWRVARARRARTPRAVTSGPRPRR